MRVPHVIVCGLLGFGIMSAAAQSPIVGAAKAPTHPPEGISGRWLGAFDIVQPTGDVKEDMALLHLKQEGTTLTGTAGPSDEKSGPLSEGEVHGKDVHFAVTIEGVVVRFALKVDGDRLRGGVTGVPGVPPEAHVAVNLARWPEGAAAPELIHVKNGLFTTVSALDTKLFDAYNHCDLDTMSSMVGDDLEFYHDKTGLSVGKQPFLDAIKNNVCASHTQRTLVPGTLEVYPLNGYGAVEVGIHRFQHAGDPGTTESKFVTIWRNKDGVWKITRAISYDHEPLKQ